MWICTCCGQDYGREVNALADLVCKNEYQRDVKSFESLLFDSAV